MSGINRRRRQEQPKEETVTEEQKPELKRSAPVRVEHEGEIAGVKIKHSLFRIEYKSKDGENVVELYDSFAEATAALKVAKLASKAWIAKKILERMKDRLDAFEPGKQYPEHCSNEMRAIFAAMNTFLVEIDKPNKGGDDDSTP